MPSSPGVPGGALPFSGPLDLAAINSEWGLGTDLTLYHGVQWYYDGNLTTGVFNSTTLKVSDFYGKRATDPASSGAYFSNTSGSGSFVTPLYRNTITIEIWGAGGGGGGANGSNGAKGGDTSIVNYQPPSGGTFTSDYTAGGGGGGQGGSVPIPAPALQVTSDRGGGRELGQYGYSYNGKDYTAFTDSTGQLVGTLVQDSQTGAVLSTIGDTGAYGTDATRDAQF